MWRKREEKEGEGRRGKGGEGKGGEEKGRKYERIKGRMSTGIWKRSWASSAVFLHYHQLVSSPDPTLS